MKPETILHGLRKSIADYDREAARQWAAKAVEGKVDPNDAIDVLMEAVNQIGAGFADGRYWLPDLIGAAETMKSALPVLEEEIRRRGTERKVHGTIVLGTVLGDIHDIGKSIVGSCLVAGGFKVIDLGVNVSAERFLEAVRKHKPDILAMSSLLTTTAAEQAKVITALEDHGVRGSVKVIVGGGAITSHFADSIGADGYESSGIGAVALSKRLIGRDGRSGNDVVHEQKTI